MRIHYLARFLRLDLQPTLGNLVSIWNTPIAEFYYLKFVHPVNDI